MTNHPLANTIPIPRHILDEAMPRLTDTELRVLLSVARQTIGWRTAQGERRRRQWISHSWFVKLTGRSSASVSAALESLVQRNLIQITDAKGHLMHSKRGRRSHRGHLYFELAYDTIPQQPAEPGAAQKVKSRKRGG